MQQSPVQSIKGTRDFYPELFQTREWLVSKIKKVSEAFGYQPYEGPYLEKLELYAAKSGDELVKEQAFCFEDRGGEFISLRPELTPTLARMVAQKQRQLAFPLRWYQFGPFWRYERPQRGRSREFFQWNIDLLGVNSAAADAEMICICAAFFESVGLTPDTTKIQINHRGLMDGELNRIGIVPEQKKDVFRLIDRRGKMNEAAWCKYAVDLGLATAQIEGIADLLMNSDLWKSSDDLARINEAVKAAGYEAYVEFTPTIIRGLDYYTGTVFEAMDIRGGRALLGGGHYDNLVGDVGGEQLPGVGFAMGDVMISVVLEDYGLLPDYEGLSDTVMVTIFDETTQTASLALASMLRSQGIKASLYPETEKLVKQFKYADRMGMAVALVLGPDEIANNTIAVKDLRSRNQVEVPAAKIIETVNKFLA
ncbi:MAG TPA: histidine--tRNA ligase [Chloroflexi bacterium]|nr:histidine--tRNA ligase [Chloroflexota bacterium]